MATSYHAKYSYTAPPVVVALFRVVDDSGTAEFYDRRRGEWVFSGIAATAVGWDTDITEVGADVADAVIDRWRRVAP